jgi:hypothetical protein
MNSSVIPYKKPITKFRDLEWTKRPNANGVSRFINELP